MKYVGALLGVAVVAFILYRSIDTSLERRNNEDCGCGKKPPIEADAQPVPPPTPPQGGMPQPAPANPQGGAQTAPSEGMSSQEPSEPTDELKDEEENYTHQQVDS